jgi:ribosomal protein S18 acetylase RimI-like enzyme
MPDMLVKLYELPDLAPALERTTAAGITIRRGLAPEKHIAVEWVREYFGDKWASETDVAFTRQPVSCFIATQQGQMLGFACYDTTARGFFGPTGVSEETRGKGVGKALLLVCLHDMVAQGYGYGIIGGAGPVDFYAGACNATLIEGSWPGVYRGLLGTDW